MRTSQWKVLEFVGSAILISRQSWIDRLTEIHPNYAKSASKYTKHNMVKPHQTSPLLAKVPVETVETVSLTSLEIAPSAGLVRKSADYHIVLPTEAGCPNIRLFSFSNFMIICRQNSAGLSGWM